MDSQDNNNNNVTFCMYYAKIVVRVLTHIPLAECNIIILVVDWRVTSLVVCTCVLANLVFYIYTLYVVLLYFTYVVSNLVFYIYTSYAIFAYFTCILSDLVFYIYTSYVVFPYFTCIMSKLVFYMYKIYEGI
jgi:hypothetical protein